MAVGVFPSRTPFPTATRNVFGRCPKNDGSDRTLAELLSKVGDAGFRRCLLAAGRYPWAQDHGQAAAKAGQGAFPVP